ncbi:hypothetical protein A5320_21060 [Rheinheimera sp. SA_1]|nr:hypothetical protein A5320_21060 [Rheinheimera sp. SA_1]
MDKSIIIAATFAAVLAAGFSSEAIAAEKKEKCYGVAAAGQNDCANLTGSHSCAGMAKTDNDIAEYRLVAKGTCEGLGGLSKEQAKAKLGLSDTTTK